jgi:hypothetical protein
MLTPRPTLVLATGIALMFFCMYTEGEPGGIPLLLIASGIVWRLLARIRDGEGRAQPRRAGD